MTRDGRSPAHARDNSRDAGDPDDEADVCEHELAHAQRTSKLLRKVLRLVLVCRFECRWAHRAGHRSGRTREYSVDPSDADSEKACQACI